MKFIVSSAVLLSAIPGAFSAELEPQPHLRGPVVVAWSSNSNSGYNGGSSDDFDNGYTEGKKQATNIWNDYYGSNGCESISSYNTKIQNYIDYHFSNNSSSEQSKSSFNQGAAAGMKSVMKQYDSQCHNGGGDYDNNDFVDIDSCSMVGQDMASQIAEEWSADNCNYSSRFNNLDKAVYSRFGNTQECITIANDDCVGMMDQKFKLYCQTKYDDNDYSDLKMLKGKCYNKVSYTIKNPN
mmetsp:Transcript_13892/g.23617  ORF Transcript_13892/g.23617 Transcript_13892/m.23617 type:complete len:239 (-) Transcript_13892:122-838(-)